MVTMPKTTDSKHDLMWYHGTHIQYRLLDHPSWTWYDHMNVNSAQCSTCMPFTCLPIICNDSVQW